MQFSGRGAKLLFRSQKCEVLLACFTLSLKIIPNKNPMFDLKYLFPGQSKYFDFLLLSLLTTQRHSGALWWCGGSAGGHPSAPAWLGLCHPLWQGVLDCALATEARDGKENPTFLLIARL